MKAAIFFALSACVLICLAGCNGVSHTIEIPRDTVQSSLEGSFPLRYGTPGETLPLEVELSEPEVLMEAGASQMGLRLKVAVLETEPARRRPLPGPPPLADQPPEGFLTVYGDLQYDRETAEFFYRNFEITDLQMKMLPGPRKSPVRDAVGAALKRYFDRTAVYKLEGDDTTMQAARLLLKSVAVKDGKLLVELGL